MSIRLARALAGVPAYAQPFQGPHNEPYPAPQPLPVGQAPFMMPGAANLPRDDRAGGQPLNPMQMGMGAPQVQAATMPPSQHVSGPPPMPHQSQAPMMGFDPTPPASMEMQGMQAPMPTGRNELERDYYNQLAQNPNGFGKPDWLSRWLG